MVQTLERPEARPAPEGDTLVREAPARTEAPEAPPIHRLPDRDVVIAPAPRQPTRWMRWLIGVFVLAIAAGGVFLATRGDGDEPLDARQVELDPATRQVPSGSPFDAPHVP